MVATLTLPLQSSGKMEVTPQQSEILQKELFKMGYAPFGKQDTANYIYWNELKQFTHGNVANAFSLVKLPLHLFDNHFKIEE